METSNIILGLKDAAPLGKGMAWANNFSGLLKKLDEPSQDCPKTLPTASKSALLSDAKNLSTITWKDRYYIYA